MSSYSTRKFKKFLGQQRSLRQYWRRLLLICLFGAGLLSGCGRISQEQTASDVGVTIEMTVEPTQPAVGPTHLVFTLTDAQGQPIDDAKLRIEGNMTHAGMVPVFGEASAGQAGRYVVPFEWTMSGDWLVTAEVSLADGRRFSQQIPVTVQ